jgi:hypothetical protein
MINRISLVYYLNKNIPLPESFQYSPMLLALTIESLVSQSYDSKRYTNEFKSCRECPNSTDSHSMAFQNRISE